MGNGALIFSMLKSVPAAAGNDRLLRRRVIWYGKLKELDEQFTREAFAVRVLSRRLPLHAATECVKLKPGLVWRAEVNRQLQHYPVQRS